MQSEAQRTQIEEKTFFECPMGVQIAWFSSIVGVILGLIPLGLYFQERKKSKLLNAVLDQYAIALKIEADAQRATTAKTTTDEALQVSKQELAELTRQLEHTIPIQARAAFFQAALPEVDRQILYLQEQRRAMEARLSQKPVWRWMTALGSNRFFKRRSTGRSWPAGSLTKSRPSCQFLRAWPLEVRLSHYLGP